MIDNIYSDGIPTMQMSYLDIRAISGLSRSSGGHLGQVTCWTEVGSSDNSQHAMQSLYRAGLHIRNTTPGRGLKEKKNYLPNIHSEICSIVMTFINLITIPESVGEKVNRKKKITSLKCSICCVAGMWKDYLSAENMSKW